MTAMERAKEWLEGDREWQMQGYDFGANVSGIIRDLLAECEEKDRQLKLVQHHAKTAMDKLPLHYNKGLQQGIKQAGLDYEKAHEAFKQLKADRATDNANFTEEIMRLEAECERLKEQVKEVKLANDELNDALCKEAVNVDQLESDCRVIAEAIKGETLSGLPVEMGNWREAVAVSRKYLGGEK